VAVLEVVVPSLVVVVQIAQEEPAAEMVEEGLYDT